VGTDFLGIDKYSMKKKMDEGAAFGSRTSKLQFLGREAGNRMAPIRVLVVEDFEPFRRFICSTLGTRSNLKIIGEAADGSEAVQKAGELRPDLILLDIGLPTMNGIAAAREIRKLTPDSKIIFVTQESSADVVQEALGTGALGYVVKTTVNGNLLAAVDAVLEGKEYVGTISNRSNSA